MGEDGASDARFVELCGGSKGQLGGKTGSRESAAARAQVRAHCEVRVEVGEVDQRVGLNECVAIGEV